MEISVVEVRKFATTLPGSVETLPLLTVSQLDLVGRGECRRRGDYGSIVSTRTDNCHVTLFGSFEFPWLNLTNCPNK